MKYYYLRCDKNGNFIYSIIMEYTMEVEYELLLIRRSRIIINTNYANKTVSNYL